MFQSDIAIYFVCGFNGVMQSDIQLLIVKRQLLSCKHIIMIQLATDEKN